MRNFVFSGLLALALVCGSTASAHEYRVLVIRVDFPSEEPDHDTTSGRGNFDLGNYYTDAEVRSRYTDALNVSRPWDIPPHDSVYFSHHLTALDRYLRTVSEDRVSISWRIWPEDKNGAYRMAKTFYKYGNGRTTEETYKKLAELFREAVEACKTAEGSRIDFSEYDTFMIIHAGMGQETSGVLNDIPSAYLSPTDFDTYLGGPLTVDGVPVANGIILPEMIADNGYGGLNGMMAQMFGFRLGLPSLSNNTDGLPAAGGWSLMDTGGISYGYSTRGFIPTHPEIWSKIQLGWITPVTVTSDTTLDIAATHINNGIPRAIRIPITADEYLLLENRERHASRDSLPNVTFSDTDTSGVWMAVDHYDAFIPGSGVLIWHINDRIIREHRTSGAVNNSRYRRGVDLLEADGQQDIGAIFGYGDDRSEYSEGWEGDTFKKGNHSTLSPTTEPNSGSMWDANSGVTVKVNSVVGDVMNVTITFAAKAEQVAGVSCKNGNLTAADLDGDGAEEIILSGADTLAVIDGATGTTAYLPSPWHPVVLPGTNTATKMLAVARRDTLILYNKSLSRAAMIMLQNSVNAQPLYTKTTSGGHVLVPMKNAIADVVFDDLLSSTVDTISTASTIVSLAAAEDFFSAIGTDGVLYTGKLGGSVYSIALPGTPDTLLYGPVIADMDRDGTYDVTVTRGKRIIMCATSATGEPSLSGEVTLSDEPAGAPAVADIDRDGYPEIVLCTTKQIFAFRANGVPVTGFPHAIPPGDTTEVIMTAPIIADLDVDGHPDIAFGTSNERLIAYNAAGEPVTGYPVALLGVPCGSPLLFRRSASEAASIAYGDTAGILYTRELAGSLGDSSLFWPMTRGGAGLAASLVNIDIPSALKLTAAFEAFCYPNPVTSGTGTFRIIPESTTDCRITVFSAEGKKVFEHYTPESQMIPGVPNEVNMDASDMASGLYIAKIQTRTRTKIYKLGVIK